jgi:hypothetical protein
MKNLNFILVGAAIAATSSLAYNASAQFKPAIDDGIAASPKVRQMLNEAAPAPRYVVLGTVPTVTYRTVDLEGVTAPPKTAQMLAEQRVVVSHTSPAEVASVGYYPTGPDGVTASPKLRQQLDEQHSAPIIIIAPLK